MFTKIQHLSVVKASVLAVLAGCSLMSPPDNLDLRLSKNSAANVYAVAIRPLVEQVAVNKIHSWEIQLKDGAGVPVRNASIAVDGGMPQHGHGLPTKPRVTGELEEGRYRLDGVKFSMTGWWEVKLAIDGAAGSDKITFNLVLPEEAGKAGAP